MLNIKLWLESKITETLNGYIHISTNMYNRIKHKLEYKKIENISKDFIF